MKYFFLVLFILITENVLACFSRQEIQLQDHLQIKGVSVNDQLVFLNEAKREYASLGQILLFDESNHPLSADHLLIDRSSLNIKKNPKELFLKVKFTHLKKEIVLIIDPTKTEMAKSRGGCGSKLSIGRY